jgi:hypothetical protein
VGNVVLPLQSINYHDCCAHGHERHGPFTRLVGFGWVGSLGFESSCFDLWYATDVSHVSTILGLAIGGMPMSSIGLVTGEMSVSVGQFGYRFDSCELVALGYS